MYLVVTRETELRDTKGKWNVTQLASLPPTLSFILLIYILGHLYNIRQFLPGDQFFPLLGIYCSLYLHTKIE